jgi:hypothetical protein
MDPHRSFSNSIVKGYSGEDTKGVALWENNTMSKFTLNYLSVYIYGFLRNCSS